MAEIQLSEGIRNIAGRLASGDLSVTALADGTGVLLDIAGHQVLTLNETALFILERVAEGVVEIPELASLISQEFTVENETEYVQDLNEFLGLLINACQTTP